VSRKGKATTEATEEKKLSNHAQRNLDERKKQAKIDPLIETQFGAGRLYAVISSRPGQSGRADGYVLEGKELEVSFWPVRAISAVSHRQDWIRVHLVYGGCMTLAADLYHPQFYLRKIRTGKQKHAA
jgi:hypothetical protein